MKNKVVIVTGASSGIGRAIALRFAEEGAKVVITARSIDKLKEVEEELITKGGEALAVQSDVSKEEDCKRTVEETMKRFGQIDILVNNAGISMRALFEESELEVIEQVMNINFWGCVYSTKYALPHILKNKGSVIGISSIAGYVGLPARTGYSASKFAMHGFLNALRTENLNKGLHVLIACPGFTASNIRNTALVADGSSQGETPRKEEKMMSAEEVADYIYHATRKRKQTLVLTSEGKLAVFFSKWAPRILQKMVFNKMRKEADSPLQ